MRGVGHSIGLPFQIEDQRPELGRLDYGSLFQKAGGDLYHKGSNLYQNCRDFPENFGTTRLQSHFKDQLVASCLSEKINVVGTQADGLDEVRNEMLVRKGGLHRRQQVAEQLWILALSMMKKYDLKILF